MGTETKLFTSDMPGAPVLSGTAGALIAVLDAVLVNGFGLVSVTGLTVTGGVATATFSAGHSFVTDSVALFAGATPAGLNGAKRPLTIATNSITFDATGVADGAATGTITAKVAPAGWAKLYTGTNLAVYKPTVVEASGCSLRVDDTGTTFARVVGYETMSDIDTGTGPFPSPPQVPGGMYWNKASVANATAIPWEVFSDDRGFYLSRATYVANNAIYTGREVTWFGDINSVKSVDAYGCVLVGARDTTINNSYGLQIRVAPNSPASYLSYLARSHNQVGGAVPCCRWSYSLASDTGALNTISGGTNTGTTYPNAANGALITSPVLVIEGSTTDGSVWRGTFPGLYHTPAKVDGAAFTARDVVAATNDLAGRRLVAVVGYPIQTTPASSGGVMFIDATGPWR